ncbi:MAG TPA: ATP-binding protein [Solimonas sp.]|nr:ATP-binding protein [Solimonas sp.]
MEGHFVRFYERDDFLVDEVSAYIDGGLAQGESGIVIATPAHRAGLVDRLNGRLAKAADRFVALDAVATLGAFMVDGLPDEQRFASTIGPVLQRAAAAGNGRIRAFGEMVALLVQQDNEAAAIRLEQLWNGLARSYTFDLFCAYPMDSFTTAAQGESFRRICHEHPGGVCPTESFAGNADSGAGGQEIALLQQKAAALEFEVRRCRQLEATLRAREHELADFVDNAAEGLHRVGGDGRLLWANRAELELLGYAPHEYIGHHFQEFHADAQAAAALLARLQRGETVIDFPATLRCKDGSIRHVLINSNALIENAELVYTRCFTRDVTERLRLEQELKQRLDEQIEGARRKDEFLAMLGHELRNPLAPIVTSLELMRLQGDDPRRSERSREIISRQVALMTRLVDDLLDVSRITRGKVELKSERIGLNATIEAAVELSRPLIDEQNHRLMIDVPAEPISVLGDPARLSQVLANLLNNAARYTPGGGRIALTVRREGPNAVISVRDNGVGLASEIRDKVFDLFFQCRDDRVATRGGLGLGLTVVRTIVQLHGGSVQALSAGPGQGSEFIVRLPIYGEQALPAALPAVKTTESPPPARAARALKILVVDDNIDAAQSLGDLLRLSGHLVRIATDGAAALEEAARLRPDAVVLDIGMPQMDGYEVARRLRQELKLSGTVVLALSGYAQERDRQRSREAGFDHHLAKPVDVERLQALLGATDGAVAESTLH